MDFDVECKEPRDILPCDRPFSFLLGKRGDGEGDVAGIGAKQTRLEIDRTQNGARFAELEKLTGADTDADLSEVLVELRQTQTAYQAALQSGSQALSMSLLDYLR